MLPEPSPRFERISVYYNLAMPASRAFESLLSGKPDPEELFVKSIDFGGSLLALEGHINALILQWDRLMEHEETYAKELPKVLEDRTLARILTERVRLMQEKKAPDLHFYLISWGDVKRYFEHLRDLTRDHQIGLIYRPITKMLQDATAVRNYEEHPEMYSNEPYGRMAFYTLTGDDELAFTYRLDPKKPKNTKSVLLGKAEVRRVMLAYEALIKYLNVIVSQTRDSAGSQGERS